MNDEGVILSLQGQVAEISFTDKRYRPAQHDILTVVEAPGVQLEAVMSSSPTSFYCLVLTPGAELTRGMHVTNTKQPLQVPVGEVVLGRALDIFGQPHDGGPPPSREVLRPLFANRAISLNEVTTPQRVLETGIKAIDFFTPVVEGGTSALIGGAGIGKTVILTELVNRLVIQRGTQADTVAVFAAVGERSREAHELYMRLTNAEVLPYTALLLGQMGENPAIRSRTAHAAAAVAEYFRDESGKRVIFFMDNIYRFAQAGHELATLMHVIPSEDGYQPTLPSEMAALNERLISTTKATTTSFLALYVPSDDLTDYAVRSVFPYVDTMVVLSRDVYQAGRFPAIDLLSSTSIALNPLIVGILHYTTFITAKRLLEEADSLERMVSLIGESELSPENRQVYRRAQLIISYMTQDLFVSQAETGHEAAFVPLKETVRVVADILAGKYDQYDPDDLRYIGSIENIKQPAQQRTAARS
ncbi:MAG: F0F1 ATP synthase subunit beta [Candidatus Andersenbacteria bacterium CG10_big_fil_rev_8_21_14_0_10_54_11]|uniref:F0F1 ATP synthase subunit beta n=1 Tax=Candidatus Andersenbacteria bacterium CG10_big_fil_rev_8_21_14_0_10_54_11 TaxID=1974485 RepID=A0A2M6WZA8_9BACT|nr:MAG: F0F1 ATP synthase subunit beta [Candidatus Andersenbacteria bacterium CG10_big_fil_rev_8_21_14_0_10_54_11]